MIVATWTFLELDPTLRISIAAVDAPGKLQQRAGFFFFCGTVGVVEPPN